ncbi:MBL fold metallo-hydrolase [Alicyclobacillus acidocaldarius]|uniref:Beta-lactamase domain protein n=1 Tax=Alicyclobacillus acidocaldarius (strain Tc-4-1) TaxID=1048834 RepID=F8ICK4_ALIAT|nr:MBL fold metallo-hydrolase [Alicyclobacillus acidocaldarius]AEJ42480.1 beta-lactamase domain protein [Alicyclobacillus acidocaldarius subsp. acidocaldarius Tc-4-1]
MAMQTGIERVRIETPYPEDHVNAYLILGDPLTLVDSGLPFPKSLVQLEEGLARHGVRFADIEQIVVTHMHLDHIGGVSAVQRASGARIVVSEAARRIVELGEEEHRRFDAFYAAFAREAGSDVRWESRIWMQKYDWRDVVYVRDGDVVRAGGRDWRVMYVPGHSRTDIFMVDPAGHAIAGDHLLPTISANAFVEPPVDPSAPRPKPLLDYRASMARTRALDLVQVYPGHGDPFADHRALIDRRFAEHESRCAQIREALAEGATTVAEITRRLFPKLEGPLVMLGLSEVQGHLDLMESRGEVTSVMDGEVRRWTRVAASAG